MKFYKQNKKGTVLFTVISIMLLMMVMVMATFTVVMAAQKKALNNFTDSQSYVTAKSVIDTYISCLSDKSEPAYNPMREQLIGKAKTDKTGMQGGLDYPDRITNFPGDSPSSSDEECTIEVTMPTVGVSAEKVMGFGELNDKDETTPETLNVQRLSRSKFKISVKVADGDTLRTVSQIVQLSPGVATSLFDSSLISKSGKTTLHSAAQLYGGFVNLSSTGTELDGTTRYYGNIFSMGKITNVANMSYEVYLSTKKMLIPGDPTPIYKADHFEAQRDIVLSSGSILSYVPSGEPAPDRLPYIYASWLDSNNDEVKDAGEPAANIKIGSTGVGVYIGRKTAAGTGRVDMFSEGDVELIDVQMWGDIYCKGNVTLTGTTQVYGTVHCNNTVTGVGKADGGKAILSSSSFPTPYKINEYNEVNSYLTNTKYYKDKSTPESTRISLKGIFDGGAGQEVAELNPTNPLKWKGPAITISEASNFNTVSYGSGSGAGTVLAGELDLTKTEGNTLSGKKITVKLGAKDMFINVKNMPTHYNYNETKITLEYTLPNRKDCGNVYFLLNPSGEMDWTKVEFGMTETYLSDSTVHKYGSKGTDLEEPSHFYMIIKGGNKIEVNTSAIINGYIYAPDVLVGTTMNLNGYDITGASGADLVYDNYSINGSGNKFNINGGPNSTPAFIGSCIAKECSLFGKTSSIYIEPHENIFDKTSTMLPDKYDWSPNIYSNN